MIIGEPFRAPFSHYGVREFSMSTNAHETRVHGSLLAAAEKRLLVRLAQGMPARINSDHLTVLASVSLLLAGICFWLAPDHPVALPAIVALLALNWFGDSLDGTLARVRRHERPRYGFYVDHVLDALGILFLIAGLVAGGYMSTLVGGGFLVAYYLLTIEIALATHALKVFRISYWKFGPTELRILLAIGTLQLLRSDAVSLFGARVLLFDLGGAVAIAALLATFLVSAARNTMTLYRLEPLPAASGESARPEGPAGLSSGTTDARLLATAQESGR
jgi:phosphatidylglycerophosphate synthase